MSTSRSRTQPRPAGRGAGRPSPSPASTGVAAGSGPIEVWVLLGGVATQAGFVYSHRRGRTESASFTYIGDYLAAPGAYALDPTLPLTSGTLQTPTGMNLFGTLSDCAPDRWGRTLVKKHEAALARAEGRATRQLGEIDYLLGVRDDLRQGALRFRRSGGPFLAPEDHGVPALTDLPALLDLAARAEDETADLSDLQRLIRVGSSLGGARPKAHVRDLSGRIAIAKFPSARSDTWDVMAWEKVALDLAHAAGVVVPPSRLLNLAGRNVVVVDRFDRSSAGERIGYVSAMTMLEANDGDQRSYLEIADVIEQRSLSARAELAQLWRRMAFTVLISNTDDHLRNHGFLHDGADAWRLAPAFDLNPDPAPGPKLLSTTIDFDRDEADIAVVMEVAEQFRLDKAQAAFVLGEVVDSVSSWRRVAGRHGLGKSAQDDMAAAFTRLGPARDLLATA